jgi:CIC family chloride channel protein
MIWKNIAQFLKKNIGSPLYRFLIEKDPNMIILGGVVGVCTGFGAEFFRLLILFFRDIFFNGRFEFLNTTSLSWYLIILIPMAGGLLIGPLTYFFPAEAKGDGIPEVMRSIVLKNGVIKKRTILLRSLASAVCLGSGGSAGREGPIVQIGSAIGSTLGQLFNISAERMKILVGCGAAGGIAAIFNAPLGGVLFAMEIVMGEFTISTFTPIIVSSVAATAISHAFHANNPEFLVPVYQIISYWEIIFYIILGLLSGFIARFFVVTLYKFEDFFENKVKIHPILKPALGGFVLGCLAIFFPQILGNGYENIRQALYGHVVWYIAFFLIFVKILATSITLGSGGSGGIFAPSLFVGSVLGSAFGSLVHFLFPAITATKGAYALVGMGAVFAAAAHAPMTNILILFEITNEYQIIVPIMVSCIISTSVARYLSPDSIYTWNLRKLGINIHKGREVSIMGSLKVSGIVNKNFEVISENTSFRKILNIISNSKNWNFPVVNSNNRMVGILSLANIREVMFEEGLKGLVVAKDLATTDVVSLFPKNNLNEALEKFASIGATQLPVVDPEKPDRVIGMLSRGDVISTYNKKVQITNVQ